MVYKWNVVEWAYPSTNGGLKLFYHLVMTNIAMENPL